MNYIDLTEQQGGGSGGTTNYNELSNQPQINGVTLTGNKTSSDLHLMSDANFLPDGYTINLKADGTGDFETIQKALNSLADKTGLGTVTIYLNAGTYSMTSGISCDKNKLAGIKYLNIKGATESSVVLNFSNVAAYNGAFNCYELVTAVRFENLTIVNQDTLNNQLGIKATGTSYVIIQNCTLTGWQNALQAYVAGHMILYSKVTCQNCSNALSAANAFVTTDYGCELAFTNVSTGINISDGGIVMLSYAKRVFSNVINMSNVSIGTANASGYFGGSWHT